MYLKLILHLSGANDLILCKKINLSFALYFRSDKLKPFWLCLVDVDLTLLHSLTNALPVYEPTLEYRDAVTRALDIRGCRVVPFFGTFLRDLRSILSGVPSIVVLPSDDNAQVEVSF